MNVRSRSSTVVPDVDRARWSCGSAPRRRRRGSACRRSPSSPSLGAAPARARTRGVCMIHSPKMTGAGSCAWMVMTSTAVIVGVVVTSRRSLSARRAEGLRRPAPTCASMPDVEAARRAPGASTSTAPASRSRARPAHTRTSRAPDRSGTSRARASATATGAAAGAGRTRRTARCRPSARSAGLTIPTVARRRPGLREPVLVDRSAGSRRSARGTVRASASAQPPAHRRGPRRSPAGAISTRPVGDDRVSRR